MHMAPKRPQMTTPSRMPPGRIMGTPTLQKPKKRSSICSIEGIIKVFICGMIFFYLGLWVGWKMDRDCECTDSNSSNLRPGSEAAPRKSSYAETGLSDALKAMGKLVDEQKANEEKWALALANMKVELDEHKDIAERRKSELEKKQKELEKEQNAKGTKPHEPNFRDLFRHKWTGNFAQGFGFADRTEFMSLFDSGVPMDKSGHGNDQVFLLYTDNGAMPDRNATKKTYPNGWEGISAKDATKNCRNLHVVYTSEGRKQQCIAVMGQYESFHIQKFMRLAKGERQKERVQDMNQPLRLVNRNMQLNGEVGIQAPRLDQTMTYWKILTPYLDALDGVLKELEPVAKLVASKNEHKAIVIMVCNFGHSEMLMNFVCNSHAKGEETSAGLKNILVFSTDIQTHQLVQSLGLTSFYNPTVFGQIPNQAAPEYGDPIYSKIMMSKVYCAHLISLLGYDFLFQDVDLVWYKDPLPFFYRNETKYNVNPSHYFSTTLPGNETKDIFAAKEWDMIFQDDGARTLFFSPYAANTGFYFVRNNRRTQHFFNKLLLAGDLVMSLSSHQSALIAQLSEFASLYGLRIKTWNRFTEEFPGGYTFHQQKEWMKRYILSKNNTDARGLTKNEANMDVDPYIFHMSWTVGKERKLKFFEQLGEWYLMEKCNVNHPNYEEAALKIDTISSCCAAKPLFKCHYKDKPSMIPCPDAPSLDKTKKAEKSFWDP